MFFGTRNSIVGIKIKNSDLFKSHVKKVRNLFVEGKISRCIGWQVYQSYAGLPICTEKLVKDSYVMVQEESFDINSPEDYKKKVIQKKEQNQKYHVNL